MQRYNITRLAPFILLLTLLSLFCREVYASNTTLESRMHHDPVPSFSLPLINNANKSFTQQDLQGHVSLINIWASWCSACKMEHNMLMKIKESYGIPIYGILYRDDASDALKYLTRHGNPYTVIGNDESGDTSAAFDVYGTPETYVISPNGDIIYRQIGTIDEYVWNKIIFPMIKPYLPKKNSGR